MLNYSSSDCGSMNGIMHGISAYGDDCVCATVVDQIMSFSPGPFLRPLLMSSDTQGTHSIMVCSAVTASSPSICNNRVTITVYNTPL